MHLDGRQGTRAHTTQADRASLKGFLLLPMCMYVLLLLLCFLVGWLGVVGMMSPRHCVFLIYRFMCVAC